MPRTASEKTGNNVPQKTAKHITTKTKLLNKNPLSLEVKDSILFSDLKSDLLKYMSVNEKISIKKTKIKKIGPNEDAVKECTELITPDLVKNVPNIQSVKVKIINAIFQIRNISFFS